MKKLIFVLLVILHSSTLYSYTSNNMYFAGIEVGFNYRSGLYDFGNNKEQEMKLPDIITTGLTFGKRIELPLHLRFEIPVQLSYGSIDGQKYKLTIIDGGEEEVVMNTSLYHAGLSPQLQLSIPLLKELAYFIGVGGGAHFIFLREQEEFVSNRNIKISDDPYVENHSGFSFSFSAATGLDIIFNQTFGLAVQYGFRYWYPVNDETHRDLFPLRGIKYKERFFTHTCSLILLISR